MADQTFDPRLESLLREALASEAASLPFTVAPDHVLERAASRKSRQHVGWRALLGRSSMPKFLPALGSAAAIVVIAALALGIYVNNPRSGVGAPPSPSPTSAPTTKPTATPEPTSTAEAGLPLGPFNLSRPRPGSDIVPMTVTIPASGWFQLVDFNFLKKGNGVDLAEALVMPMAYPAGTGFYVPGDPCQSTSTRPDTPVTTVDDLVAALAAQASRDASEPVDVMVGGYAGKSVTLHVPDDAPFDGAMFDGCENRFFISYDTEQSGDLWHHRPGQIDDLWIVDVDGVIVVIDAEYGPDTPAELVEEMRTLAQSVTFGTP